MQRRATTTNVRTDIANTRSQQQHELPARQRTARQVRTVRGPAAAQVYIQVDTGMILTFRFSDECCDASDPPGDAVGSLYAQSKHHTNRRSTFLKPRSPQNEMRQKKRLRTAVAGGLHNDCQASHIYYKPLAAGHVRRRCSSFIAWTLSAEREALQSCKRCGSHTTRTHITKNYAEPIMQNLS